MAAAIWLFFGGVVSFESLTKGFLNQKPKVKFVDSY
jgi:hypothetical protein